MFRVEFGGGTLCVPHPSFLSVDPSALGAPRFSRASGMSCRWRSLCVALFASAAPALAGLSDLIVQNSLVAALEPDPASLQKGHDVRATREVMSGHYVRVDPQPLKEPYYIAHSEAMCAELGLDADVCKSESMIKIFSGDAAEARAHGFERGWATAYALSIYGKEMLPNNAGRNGWG